jgi:hypothetical protein
MTDHYKFVTSVRRRATRPGTGSNALVLHWNGTAWKQQPSLTQAELFSVAATSPASAWTAGSRAGGQAFKTLIEHWNGTAWSQQASPNPAGFAFGSQLAGVAATSLSSAWAVGESVKDVGPSTSQTLIARWNGTAWAQASSPNPGGTGSGSANFLFSVTATSSSNAWAVGGYATSPTANGAHAGGSLERHRLAATAQSVNPLRGTATRSM